MLLIGLVLGSIYVGVATATEAAAFGVVGSLAISATQGSLNRRSFTDSLLGATRLYCMIALILSGAAFLTLAMGYIGLPRHLAEWIGGLGLSPFALIVALMVFYIVLGCFLDGISMVVLTMGVILPTVQAAGIDLLWFGIFIVLVVEMAQITPPVGFNLFVLQGMTKKQITWIARKETLPMFYLMIVAVLLIWFFPDLVTALPQADEARMKRVADAPVRRHRRSAAGALGGASSRTPFAVLGIRTARRHAHRRRVPAPVRARTAPGRRVRRAGRRRDRALPRRSRHPLHAAARPRRARRSSAASGTRSTAFRSASRAPTARSRARCARAARGRQRLRRQPDRAGDALPSRRRQPRRAGRLRARGRAATRC